VLRVTFCAYDSPNAVSGPLTWLVQLLPELREFQIEPHCMVLSWGGPGTLLAQLQTADVECSATMCRGSTQDRMAWMFEQLRNNAPDIFVPNLVVPAYYAARWVREAGVPTVGVLHSDDAFYTAIQDEFVSGRPEFSVTAVVCVSRELERQVCSRRPKKTSVKRIPYGVPVPADCATLSESKFRVVYIGRLVEQQKRISDVVRALCRVTRELPGVEAVIYGDGPDKKCVEEILEVEGRGLPVRLAGSIPGNQVQRELLKCDAIVLLSDYEGLPIALLEAMACGVVPVCLRMRSGIPELVQDGVTGLVVDDREDGFVQAIRKLKEDKQLWRRLSAAARDRVRGENSIQTSVRQWSTLLHELHENADGVRKIRIPKRFNLPLVNPELAPEDPRDIPASATVRLYRRARKSVGALRRKVTARF